MTSKKLSETHSNNRKKRKLLQIIEKNAYTERFAISIPPGSSSLEVLEFKDVVGEEFEAVKAALISEQGKQEAFLGGSDRRVRIFLYYDISEHLHSFLQRIFYSTNF